MKKRSIGIILALLLLFVRAGAAKSAVPEDSEKSNRTWEAGDFTIVFDGIVDESMAGKAQAYEVEFPLPDASLLDLSIFSENFPFAQAKIATEENLLTYTLESGENLSVSYGDIEYASENMRDIYAPLFGAARNMHRIEESVFVDDIPSLDGIAFHEALRRVEAIAEVLKIDYLEPGMVCWLNQNDLDALKADPTFSAEMTMGKPFYGIFFPVAFQGLPLLQGAFDAVGHSTLVGTQGQFIISKDGIEFFYSGRAVLPQIKLIDEAGFCMTFEQAVKLLSKLCADILLSEPAELVITQAQVCYVPLAQDRKGQRYTYIPCWSFHYEEGVFAFNALSGERLI